MFLWSFSCLAAWICGLFLVFATLMTSLEECLLLIKPTSVIFSVTELKTSSFSSFKWITNHQLLEYNLMLSICLFALVVVDQWAFLILSWILPLEYRSDILGPIILWRNCSMIHTVSLLFVVGDFFFCCCYFVLYVANICGKVGYYRGLVSDSKTIQQYPNQ